MLGVLKRESDGLNFIDIDTTYGDHVVQEEDLFLLSSKEPNGLQKLNNKLGVFSIAADIRHNNHYVRAFPTKTLLSDIKSKFRYMIFLCNISENAHIRNILDMDIGDNILINQILSLSLMVLPRYPSPCFSIVFLHFFVQNISSAIDCIFLTG